MLTDARYHEIMTLVDAYNRSQIGKEGYVSPFIARASGNLTLVVAQIGVPTEELDEFLTRVGKELPPID